MSTAELIESPKENRSVTTEMVSARQAQEVQAAMIVARRFPRDEDAAVARIIKACHRKILAEEATYLYQKGGTVITGPSIRMAEVMAQNWGNLDFGFVEYERLKGPDGVGVSIVGCHAWDLETNTRRSVTFNVRHWRDTKKGGYPLDDEREIYELMANSAARRLRACVLAIIPGDIVDKALDQCEKTLQGQSTEPLSDRIQKMLVAFESQGVSKAMIETKLAHVTSAITLQELAKLQKIYTSIRDGFTTREEAFSVGETSRPEGKAATIEEIGATLHKSVTDAKPGAPATTTQNDVDAVDTRESWDRFAGALEAVDTIRDVDAVASHWLSLVPANRCDEAKLLIDARRKTLRDARKAKQQQSLMETSPTSSSEGA